MLVPSVPRDAQIGLFEAALAAIEQRSAMVNMLVEVFEDGRVEVMNWSLDDHDPSHIAAPR